MPIKRVWLDESKDVCTSCKLCATIAPDVFKVPGKMVVLPQADLVANADEIRKAVDTCPTQVIKIEEA